MKKLLYCVMTMAAMCFAASCQEELHPVKEGDTNVTFTVSTGEVLTKAIADGNNVDILYWEIYKDLDDAPLGEGSVEKTSDKHFTVDLKLLADQTYNIIFWAQVKPEAGKEHYDVSDLREVKIKSYDDENANDESRAAFFRLYTFTTENGKAINEDVYLYRPFAQINLGATTYETSFTDGNVQVNSSEMTVTKIATSFNTITGEGEGEQVVTFKAAATPNGDTDKVDKILKVNELYYYWLGMNYVIVNGNSDNVTVDITLATNYGDVKHSVGSVPVKENHRTNLLGNFLTTGATFNVIVDERFVNSETGELNPDIVVGVWDGVQTEEPSVVDGYYEIYSASQWAWLRGKDLKGNNIRLMSNIDFGGYEIKGLGFKGEFDGNGFTMSNFIVQPGGSDYSNGLFQGDASGEVTVKNLTIKNAVSKCSNPSFGYAGVLFGDIQNNVTLENVHIYNAEVEGVQSVGGLVGFVASAKKLTLKNCSVNDSELSNIPVVNESGFVAGLAGRVVGTVDFDADTKVENVTIDAFYAERRGESSIQPTVAYGDNSITTQAAYTNVKITKHALLNTQETIDTQAEFETALAEGGLILLGKLAQTKAGDAAYTWKNTAKDVDIVAAEEGVAINFGTGALNGAGGAKNISFTGLVLNFQNVDYTGFHHVGTETYKDCIINGCVWTYAPVAVFDGCTLNQTGDAYNVRIYSAAEVSINNCDFTSYCKSILIYSESANEYDVTIDNSTFYAENNDGKAAVQMHTERGVHGTLKFNNTTVSGNYADINGGLYNEINKSTGAATENFVVIIDGKAYASSLDSIKEALTNGATNIILKLKDGEYTLPEPDLRGKELTITGSKDVVIDASAVDARDQFVTGATLKFEGVTLNFGKVNYMGFANTANLTYKDCDINGLQFLFGENVSFENCSLNSNGAEHTVWTYGVKNVSFTGCDFTYGDRGVNCYSDNDVPGGKQTVNFTNCTFATENTASDGAVEINSCYFSVGIEVNMEGCTAPAYGQMAYVSKWDNTNGAKTTINIK